MMPWDSKLLGFSCTIALVTSLIYIGSPVLCIISSYFHGITNTASIKDLDSVSVINCRLMILHVYTIILGHHFIN